MDEITTIFKSEQVEGSNFYYNQKAIQFKSISAITEQKREEQQEDIFYHSVYYIYSFYIKGFTKPIINFTSDKKLIIIKNEYDTYNIFEDIKIGRPSVIGFDEVQKLKLQNYTQEQCAKELNISLSTVRRNWK